MCIRRKRCALSHAWVGSSLQTLLANCPLCRSRDTAFYRVCKQSAYACAPVPVLALCLPGNTRFWILAHICKLHSLAVLPGASIAVSWLSELSARPTGGTLIGHQIGTTLVEVGSGPNLLHIMLHLLSPWHIMVVCRQLT